MEIGHHTWALENRNQKLTPSSHGGVKGNYNLLLLLLLLNAQGMNFAFGTIGTSN